MPGCRKGSGWGKGPSGPREVPRRLRLGTAIPLCAGLAFQAPAAQVQFDHGLPCKDGQGVLRIVYGLDTDRWDTPQLRALLGQLEGGRAWGDRTHDLAMAKLRTALGQRGEAVSREDRQAPGPRALSSSSLDPGPEVSPSSPPQDLAPQKPPLNALPRRWTDRTLTLASQFAVWKNPQARPDRLVRLFPDASTQPPSLVGLAWDGLTLFRLDHQGNRKVIAGCNGGQWRLGQASQDRPGGHGADITALAVAPDGTIDFSTARRQIHRIDPRDPQVRLVADLGLLGGEPGPQHGLVVGADGTRYFSDLRARRIFALRAGEEGALQASIIAGNGQDRGEPGRGHPQALEAEDALQAGMNPAKLTLGPSGELFFVEVSDNSVKKLTAGEGGWRLTTVLHSTCLHSGSLRSLRHLCLPRAFATPMLTASPDGTLLVWSPLSSVAYDLGTLETVRLADLLPGAFAGRDATRMEDLAAVSGGLFFLNHVGEVLFLETAPPGECFFDRAMEALEAGRRGDWVAVGKTRALLERFSDPPSRSRPDERLSAFMAQDGWPLYEVLARLVGDYLAEPWMAWRARWAQLHLDARP